MSDVENIITEGTPAETTESHPLSGIDTTSDAIQKNMAHLTQMIEMGFASFDMDDSTFRELTDKTIKNIKADELVRGKIITMTKDEVHVDIGFKSVGVVPRAELLNAETLKIGDEIDVFIENIEDGNGKLLLSRRRADFMRIWEIFSISTKNKKSFRSVS